MRFKYLLSTCYVGSTHAYSQMKTTDIPINVAPPIKTNPKNNGNIYRRKGRPTKVTKKVAAPLVDSTLLRFLSAQKSQIEAQEQIVKNGESSDMNGNSSLINSTRTSSSFNVSGSDLDSSLSSFTPPSSSSSIGSIMQISGAINGTELIQSMTDNLMKTSDDDNDSKVENFNYEAAVVTESTTRVISYVDEVDESKKKITKTAAQVADTTADSISWFTQYNAHNVAKKLTQLGACKKTAQEAGNAVQNYSLSRTTRQRVRKFLSDRDSIWASPSAQNEVKDDFMTTPKERKYNIQNIIDVLNDAGLTGRDIAAIFTHTPSVSMMQTKKDADNIPDSLEATLERAYFGVLCSTIKLRKCDARKVCSPCFFIS